MLNSNSKTTDLEVYKRKSEENREIVNLIREQEKFHSAINRCYYSLYQLILYIVNVKEPGFIPQGKDSHTETIDKAKEIIKTDPNYALGFAELGYLEELRGIKHARHEADYKAYAEKQDRDYFYNEFYDKFKHVYFVLSDYSNKI